MARGAWFWILIGFCVLAFLVCGGGWSPLAVEAAHGTWRLGAWGVSSLLGLVLGPTILLWVFLCGPPDAKSGRGVAGTALLLFLGVLLTVTAVLKLPLLAACLALVFLGL